MRVQENSASTLHKLARGGRRFEHSRVQPAADSRGETVDQLLDRNLAELLQELRVAFTGVQILFAFLLSLAFTQRFAELDDFDVAVYTVALLSTALATMLLIAPVSFHRIVFRRRRKAALVVVSDRLLMAGLALLIPAIGACVLLILDVVLGRWQAFLGASITVLVGLLTWYALPLAVRLAAARDPGSPPDVPDEKPPTDGAERSRPGRPQPPGNPPGVMPSDGPDVYVPFIRRSRR